MAKLLISQASLSIECTVICYFFIDVEMFDFSLLRSVPFDLVALLSMLIMLAYFIPFAFSSVRAETMGMEPHKAAFLISILGKIDSKAFET